jgi:hypothetical protein
MKNLNKFSLSLGLLSTITIATPILSQTATTTQLPNSEPNLAFNVERQSGRCPRTVNMWTSFSYYEGGGQHMVIANTAAIAGTPQIMSSSKKSVVFRAPLQREYASCVGRARSAEDDYPYQFGFTGGYVTFSVQLPADTPSNPSGIDTHSIVSSRPMVRWAIAD